MADPYEKRPAATKQSSRTKGMSMWDKARYVMSGQATKDKVADAEAKSMGTKSKPKK